jgi:raffinose/stachyose/melibiose transport system permease protein
MKTRKHSLIFWLFLAPALFAFVMVIIIPFGMGIVYSLTNWTGRPQPEGLAFIGFLNFIESLKDPSFLYSFIVTSVYTIINMIVINVVAFALALLVTSKLKLRNMYRVGFFLPNLIGGLILGYIWQFIFNVVIPNFPVLINLFPSIAEPLNYMLANRNSAVMAIVIAGSWQYAGYIMMIYIAAIVSVPAELYEASRIDGASPFRQLLHVTVPMTAQAFTISLFLTLTQSFKQYDVNVSLTGGGPAAQFLGKPVLGSKLLALDIYNTAFVSNNLAQSQARSVIFFVVLVIISIIQVRTNKRREVEL